MDPNDMEELNFIVADLEECKNRLHRLDLDDNERGQAKVGVRYIEDSIEALNNIG